MVCCGIDSSMGGRIERGQDGFLFVSGAGSPYRGSRLLKSHISVNVSLIASIAAARDSRVLLLREYGYIILVRVSSTSPFIPHWYACPGSVTNPAAAGSDGRS